MRWPKPWRPPRRWPRGRRLDAVYPEVAVGGRWSGQGRFQSRTTCADRPPMRRAVLPSPGGGSVARRVRHIRQGHAAGLGCQLRQVFRFRSQTSVYGQSERLTARRSVNPRWPKRSRVTRCRLRCRRMAAAGRRLHRQRWRGRAGRRRWCTKATAGRRAARCRRAANANGSVLTT